jgi:hypothetical protein
MYNHTQVGRLMIAVLFIVIVLFGTILASGDFDSFSIGVMVIVILIIVSFLTLKVTIDETYLRIKFGYGLFFKKLVLAEIASVEIVRNNWYRGWGIRYWVPKRMWVYNVSGFDAVEIKMKNGRVYMIGTDDPKGLDDAIKQHIKS